MGKAGVPVLVQVPARTRYPADGRVGVEQGAGLPVRQPHKTRVRADGQEDQLGALGLVLNAAVLWTTRYLDAAVEQLRSLPASQREHDVLDEDLARLSPLKHAT